MGPPRVPLSIKGVSNQLMLDTGSVEEGSKFQTTLAPITSTTAAKPLGTNTAPIPFEMVDDFKRAIDGSDLTKLGLVEHLKKRYLLTHLILNSVANLNFKFPAVKEEYDPRSALTGRVTCRKEGS